MITHLRSIILLSVMIGALCGIYANWEILNLPTDRGFSEIWAINEERIFVAGHEGLWKTLDGTNWVLDGNVHFIFFVNDTLGLVQGDRITTDGGETWQIGDTINGHKITSVSFPRGQSLIGYGETYDDVRKTEDGGWHWTKLPPLPEVYPTSEEYVYPRNICFPSDPDTGYLTVTCEEWISEDNVIPRQSYFKTTDGGQTWVLNEEGLYNDDFNPYLVDFPQNPSVGYMAGTIWKGVNTYVGYVYKTTNGGASWDTVLKVSQDYPNIYDICFPETDQVGYVLNDTMVHRTLDGGATWQTFGLGQDTVFLRCHFLNNWVGFISGTGTTAAGFLYTPGFVLKTTDGLLGIAENKWIDVEPVILEISTPTVFSRELVLRYQAREPGRLTVSVFDAAGRKTQSSGQRNVNCGDGSLTLNEVSLAPGVYFVRVEFTSAQGNQIETLRTVKVR